MNEELQELAEDVHEKENKNHEKQENILQKIANVKIEDKRVEALKEYFKTNGINLSFQAIFSEIITKNIEKEQVFAYTAMRLRQIGNDLTAMRHKETKI